MTTRLNAICAYFTMFPLEFPLNYLRRRSKKRTWVLDPFCGRGTTPFAARLLGLPSIGIDISPIAAALSKAKLVSPSVDDIVAEAAHILECADEPRRVPSGRFWDLAYCDKVLLGLCRLREELLRDCTSDARVALRAILMGALHGPKTKAPSYLSNQAPRTYAPKPAYAARYWQKHNMLPQEVNILEVVRVRATRYYENPLPRTPGFIVLGDSQCKDLFSRLETALQSREAKVGRVITSPPYPGMATYIPDQWLRNWFLGGPATVDYSATGQIGQLGVESFTRQLNRVWINTGRLCEQGATLLTRFGSVNSKKVDAKALIKESFRDSGWKIQTVLSGGTANRGRRQASSFSNTTPSPKEEFDVYAIWRS